jgi:hypothetical protein
MPDHSEDILQKAQNLLDTSEKYDVLLFVQIDKKVFFPTVFNYMEYHSSYCSTRNTSTEFFFMTAKLEDAAIFFDRYKDKTFAKQCRDLLSDLAAVQYIHVIN